MKKLFATLGTVLMLSVTSVTTVFAGEWHQDDIGWWYQYDEETMIVDGWWEIDGKDYYFDANGYMLANTITPDGYQVGPDGAWIPEVAEGDRYGAGGEEGYNAMKELWVSGAFETEADLREGCNLTLVGSPVMEELIQEILQSPHGTM